MNATIQSFRGYGIIRSDLTLEEVAAIVSEKLFGGLPFGGRDRHIFEEVPAVLIGAPIMGLLIVMAKGNFGCYVLHIEPYPAFERTLRRNNITYENQNIDPYLYHLLNQSLKDVAGVEVVEPEK